MSDLLREPPIMSVAEFRKITGVATSAMSDEQIERYIAELDLAAQLFVASKKTGGTPMEQLS